MVQENLLEMIIVGAGPAGISLASEAVQAGIKSEKILVIEKEKAHSWSIRKYYPEDKLVTANWKGTDVKCTGVMCLLDSTKDETLSYLDKAIVDHNINVNYLESVKSIELKNNGQFVVTTNSDSYLTKTIAMAIGVFGTPNKPDYKIPESISSKVFFDVTSEKHSGSKILVVGGGDSASEYVQYLSNEGNDVTISYRRDSFSRMNQINLDSLNALADQQKAKIYLESDISALEDNEGKVKVIFKERESETFDKVIYALGGTNPKNFLKSIGVTFSTEGPEVDTNFESKIPGLFVIGDLTAGKKGGSINTAFNSANTAMKEFCKYYLDCRFG